ncbi:MAG: DUF4351 domain-containing protein [Cyanobacteria bacterium P01_G01_bin.38]
MLGISELRQTKVFQEFYEEGMQKEGVTLILRQLTRRVGELSSEKQAQISELSVAQLEELGEALLDFEGLADLENWLGQLRQMGEQVLQRLSRQLGQEVDQWEPDVLAQVQGLSLSQLEALTETLLELTEMAALVDWLQAQAAENRDLE